MSTSRGWSWPVMTNECSGPPRSHDTSCCNFAVWIFWSSAPSRATPTHTVSSVTPAGDKQAGLRTADRLLRLLHTNQIQANYQKPQRIIELVSIFGILYWNTLERQEHLLACMIYTHENFPCQEKPLPWGHKLYTNQTPSINLQLEIDEESNVVPQTKDVYICQWKYWVHHFFFSGTASLNSQSVHSPTHGCWFNILNGQTSL